MTYVDLQNFVQHGNPPKLQGLLKMFLRHNLLKQTT